MAIYQLGLHGKRNWISKAPTRYTQVWCELKVPDVKWWTGAGVWIGAWTNKNKFMQTGIFPNPTNNSLMGGTRTGTTVFWYATDDVGYYIQTINEVEIEQGDNVILNLQKNWESTDWLLGVMNVSRMNRQQPNNSWFTTYRDAGDNFYITTLQLIFEGYSGIYNTQFVQNGEVSMKNIRLKDTDGVMRSIPAVREFNAEGGRYFKTKVFEAVPDWLSMEHDEDSITFKGEQ